MKRLKKFWQENSVLLVLFLILIACLVAIGIVVITYFVGDSSSKYGDRLEGIENYPFAEKEKSALKDQILEEESVVDATVNTSGKRIIVTIKYNEDTSLVDAQSKTLAVLDYLSEDILSFYDVEFNIEADSSEKTEGFKISGSHNVPGTGGIVWNNNTIFDTDEEE